MDSLKAAYIVKYNLMAVVTSINKSQLKSQRFLSFSNGI